MNIKRPISKPLRPKPLLFRKGYKLSVTRAPVMKGLTCDPSSSLFKPFRRPFTKRKEQLKLCDEALKRSTLGPRRRTDGMARLLARAGRGLKFKMPQQKTVDDDDGTGSSSDGGESDEEEDRPFEPLRIWQSPHNGGECVGLPSRT